MAKLLPLPGAVFAAACALFYLPKSQVTRRQFLRVGRFWAHSLSPNLISAPALSSARWAPGEQKPSCWATSWLLWTIGEDSSPNLRVAGATQPKTKKSQLIQGTSRGKVFPTHCGRSLCCGLCPFLFVQVSAEPQTGQVQTSATGTEKL